MLIPDQKEQLHAASRHTPEDYADTGPADCTGAALVGPPNGAGGRGCLYPLPL